MGIRFSLGRLSIGVRVRVGSFRVRVRFWLGPGTQLDPRIMYNVHPMHEYHWFAADADPVCSI